jgi:hypothetical protein
MNPWVDDPVYADCTLFFIDINLFFAHCGSDFFKYLPDWRFGCPSSAFCIPLTNDGSSDVVHKTDTLDYLVQRSVIKR